MQMILEKLKERALNTKNQKEFIALTRQIIKIEELRVNQERMSVLESRMEKKEQFVREIDKAIMTQILNESSVIG
ncbi:hypothetical protein KSK55_03960 [Methanospirillum purgamenti]|jgi:hypothetical protein|uniref:Uncharacterized protein n=1 Tax=Methanospirillum hungatei TaxID=2203 RepID=A0A8F5ZH89_METHU|nr:hypothetical protein [Methanospirillum hungatei]QXO95564.1 hypothetical protein KSK55_03960 [Methanospirillum hungatei]